MPTVDFAACLSNYWFIWAIDGFGSICSLLINVAVSFFFLKYFQFLAHGGPAPPKKRSDFENMNPASNDGIPVGAWARGQNTGNVFNGAELT